MDALSSEQLFLNLCARLPHARLRREDYKTDGGRWRRLQLEIDLELVDHNRGVEFEPVADSSLPGHVRANAKTRRAAEVRGRRSEPVVDSSWNKTHLSKTDEKKRDWERESNLKGGRGEAPRVRPACKRQAFDRKRKSQAAEQRRRGDTHRMKLDYKYKKREYKTWARRHGDLEEMPRDLFWWPWRDFYAHLSEHERGASR